MSSTLRNTNWLTQNYEKLVLVVVLLLLLCSALFLVVQVKQKSSEQLAQVRAPVQFVKAANINATNLVSRMSVLTGTNLMEIGLPFMGSELRVNCINRKCGKPIPYYAVSCPFCGASQPVVVNPADVSSANDGIPDVWKKKYGFDIFDPNVANADPDGDGFTNLEEYRAGTDPLDPKSHPDIASKLRVLDMKQHPFRLRFLGGMQMPSGLIFQLNLHSGRTLFVKIGDVAEGYRLVAHEPTAAEGDVLVLEKGAEKIRLVKGKDLQQMEMIVDLVFMLDHKRFNKVVKDSVLKIHDNEYKIVDITSDVVTIHDLRSGSDIQVPRVTEAERNEVLEAGTAKKGSAPRS